MAGATAIGSFGQIVFSVSSDYVETFDKLSRKSVAVYADHEVIGGKPASEYTGPELDEVEFVMVFNAALGVSPYREVETLREMQFADGAAYPLLVGSNVYAFFTIREIGDTVDHTLRGEPMVMSVSIVLKEYADNSPNPGSVAAARDAANRSVTGRGGPVKVPGAASPMRQRTLEVGQ